MLREEQIDLRRERARSARFTLKNLGKHRVFTSFSVRNPDSGGDYTVRIRGFDTGDNTCTCPDFKANTLGTCKHIEAVLEHLKEEQPAQVRTKKAVLKQSEIVLHYGDAVRLQLHLTARHSDKLTALAQRFFDDKHLWSGRGRYEDLIPAVEAVPEDVTVLSDAMEFINREIEGAALLRREREYLAQLEDGTLDLDLLNVPLYDYQLRGALFLACRGRSILGDDMGLGKTVQTLAAIELLVRERNAARVLVVAPASVKYQWDAEIRRFTSRAVQVIEGDREERLEQYQLPTFYRLVNYEQVIRDLDILNAWAPDVIVLDEAQRIKNWESKTSQAVKRLRSRYAMVLSGTPLENRLEELYSIVQFVDERRFGPAFQFLHDHRVLDDDGNLTGYRNLDAIRDKLAPIFLRRTRREVLGQLPARTDSTVIVELAAAQKTHYDEQAIALARLLQKGYFTDLDRKRILACLVNLRMIADSTFLFDKATHVSPKLDEFAVLVPELLEGDGHKLVVFSQWETMLHEIAAVLSKLKVGHVMLHGSLSGTERKTVLERFKNDVACRVFLSTDAGGTGLNLQMADTVVNLELPWNPAVLEQRIARVHRLGQSRPVRVLNFICRGTIEERVQKTLTKKQSLFAGLFDGDENEVEFSGVAPTTFVAAVRELLNEEQPEAPANETPNAGPLITATVAMMEVLTTFLESNEVPEAERQRLHVLVQRWKAAAKSIS
ncbi:hypothetical protein BH11PLA2_BH11PLA2_49600 [soil metagenome]